MLNMRGFRSGRLVYYGWVQALMLSITQLVSWGILYYTFSVMLRPMQLELGWSSAQITGAFSLALLVNGVSAVGVGRWLDQRGPRLLMSVGSCVAVLLVLAWSQVNSLLAFYAIWVALGISMSMVLYEPAFWVIATWFQHKRGRALTVVTFGGGLASTVFLPLSNALAITYGWRAALALLALILAALSILPHMLLLRRSPHDLGLQVDGGHSASSPTHPSSTQPKARPSGEVFRTRSFWLLSAAFAFSALAWSGMSVHLISYELSRGLDSTYVAGAASLIGVMQVMGRLALTPISDHISRKTITQALFGVQACAFIALLTLPAASGLLVYVVCFGIGFGVITPIRAALIADVYGTQQYGNINGVMSVAANLARAVAPVGVGTLVSVAGYRPVLWIGLIACVLAAVAVSLVIEHNATNTLAQD